MTDLIKDIFYREEEDGTLNYKDATDYIRADRALNACHKKVERAFDTKFMEALYTAESDICAIETLAAFRHGFRLAGRLMLEMFSERA